jgi:hypothetical protein
VVLLGLLLLCNFVPTTVVADAVIFDSIDCDVAIFFVVANVDNDIDDSAAEIYKN